MGGDEEEEREKGERKMSGNRGEPVGNRDVRNLERINEKDK